MTTQTIPFLKPPCLERPACQGFVYNPSPQWAFPVAPPDCQHPHWATPLVLSDTWDHAMGVARVVIDKWNIPESNKCKKYPTCGTDSFFSTQTHSENIMFHNTYKSRTNFPTQDNVKYSNHAILVSFYKSLCSFKNDGTMFGTMFYLYPRNAVPGELKSNFTRKAIHMELVMWCKCQNVSIYKLCTMLKAFWGHTNIVEGIVLR